ncbi:MAG: glycosyltransferase family 4 protein [Clostridiales bacterium]|nr:glycosyltransferase family 4 protein [Clostridiales bacterium]
MKILFVAHSDVISGGANRALLHMVSILRRDYGVEPVVLLPEGSGEMQQSCEKQGIKVYRHKYYRCCTVFRGEGRDLLRLIKLIAAPLLDIWHAICLDKQLSEDFELVYTNDRLTVIGAYLARRRKIPHIWHVRCFSRINRNHFPPFWYRIMERYSKRIVLISRALYQDFSAHVAEKKLRLVLDGVDISRYSAERQKKNAAFSMLIAGRLVPAKGQEDAIRALALLRGVYGADVELYIAGETPAYEPKDYENWLRLLVQELHLGEKVHFLGEVQNLPELRSEMDVELMCSWCEAFGLVSVEAMCVSLPVVGTSSGGTLDILLDGQTGFLYQTGNAEELAEKIFWLYEHPEEAIAFGKNGRNRAKELFSVEKNAAAVHAVICEALQEEWNGAKD